uniref:Chromatin modification-related protein MEAF6 n=1 Tax=Chlamydomonas leiostraca TaxID=1034604 RepID=A0A7S0WF66_9CHLO|mmetsp:Transcript_12040/g.29403  ORF Transcript_12040/g.29403 Transcript_12040/m.29403 type:complete len:121 (+) Transcript_12040:130-492(+)|eukprot:CAMPEP_0202866224 /NCGR_PEP_ID=MMETSP1391-20130828/7273_1 /ASSEMBLY_ACC=CAM_ASM_000867 /TAXON_ID=1034604 /ORGANISM="Chlamydomonas leiostraca, Strain SAG 11-49" /LENGTH=120 /DNA_ID=CAMNT_0049546157 /DNA_START=111 /DNA_END=473 /DNA_ORIENTATION=-
MAGNILEELQAYRDTLVDDLGRTERVLAEMESQYLQAEYSQAGSVLKGFESFLASKETLRKRARVYRAEDRLFTTSSRTAPQGVGDLGLMDGEGGVRKVVGGSFASKGYAQKGYAQKGKR